MKEYEAQAGQATRQHAPNSLSVPEREKAISDWEKFFDLKMKCKQRLCQRNKNLRISGYCSICDNLAEEIKKKYADKEKPNIDILIEKLQEVEVENLTNKIRLEALENWASTITKSLNQMKARNDASDRVLEVNALATEDVNKESDSNGFRDEPSNKPSIKCKICKASFSKNSELEKHLVNIHGSKKTYSCEYCDKTFLLKWRLNKHIGIHQDDNIRICKFFKDGKDCPFEDVGCKFGHKSEQVVTTRNVELATNVHEMVEIDDEIIEVEASESGKVLNSTSIFRLNDELSDDNAKDSVEVVEGDESKNEAGDEYEDEETGNDALSERYLSESSTSLLKRTLELFPVEKTRTFSDLCNLQNPHNMYPQNPPIVYTQNSHAVYPQNPPHIVYPQNPHIMYPQNQSSWNFFSANHG